MRRRRDRRTEQRRVGRGYKGPEGPIVPEKQRAEMLLALRMVDYVHIFDEADPIAFLSEVRPDVHVNGSEYGEDCIEAKPSDASVGPFTSSAGFPDCRRQRLSTLIAAAAAS